MSPYLIPVLAAEGELAGPTTYQPVVDALKNTLTETSLSSILVYAVGACAALVLFWWAVRKVSGMFMRAFKKGKLRI